MWLKSPVFFVTFSFVVGVLNFLDTFVRLMYSFMLRGASYPLGVYLKPIFFLAQAALFIMFVRSVHFAKKPVVSGQTLSRFFVLNTILIVVVVLLYVDFQISSLAGISTATTLLQPVFYVTYLVALSGISFWFALKLTKQDKWKWLSIIFVLLGFAFLTAFWEPLLFWSQNHLDLVFPSQLAFVGTYAPHILMFLAAMFTLGVIILRQVQSKNSSLSFWLILLFLVLALLLPLLWNSYKEGLINFVVRDIFYWGFGYSGKEWYFAGMYLMDSVSFYLMAIVAYIITWRELTRRSDHTLGFSLIVLGVASFPWNGVVLLKAGYSSIPGNLISLSSIITGASLLTTRREMK